MWHIYILETLDGRLYTGATNDVERRMKAHQEGKGARFTRNFGFKALLYTEAFLTKSAALKREKEIQALKRQEKLQLISKHL